MARLAGRQASAYRRPAGWAMPTLQNQGSVRLHAPVVVCVVPERPEQLHYETTKSAFVSIYGQQTTGRGGPPADRLCRQPAVLRAGIQPYVLQRDRRGGGGAPRQFLLLLQIQGRHTARRGRRTPAAH